ncbi:MAG: zinc ABC transporter substrate-binding protein [Microcystaceae cyanobacterium]
MNYFRTSLLTFLVSLNILAGCGPRPTESINETQTTTPATDSETLDVTVSIAPQEYLVEKIGGDRVQVNVMVEPGSEPHGYEPKPQQLKALSEAEAYVSVGVEFEQAWMEKFKSANPNMTIIDSAQGIDKIEMVEHHHDHHDHEAEKDHDHHDHESEKDHDHDHESEKAHSHDHSEETLDPHIWLSPQLVKVQAQNIYQGLVELDPENEADYQANLQSFITEVDQLDQQIRQNLEGVQNRKFIVFHPSWGYFAQDYDLEQIPMEVGGQEPSAAELGALVKEAKEEEIKVIFAQYEFSSKQAETLAQEINGEVIFIDPLAPNWSENLLEVSNTFAKVLD